MEEPRRQSPLKTIAAIILALIILLNLVIIVAEEKESAGILNKLPFAVVPVAGSSMEPLIHSGDAVLTTKAPFYSLKVGDIIIFARGTELITHQIVSRTRETLTTKGTANSVADSAVSLNEYKAKVICRIPLLGSLWRIGSSAVRFGVFAVLLTLVIFGKDIFSALYGKLFSENDNEQSTKAK